MNPRNLLGMDCINSLLNFLSWSISLHLLLTINFLILQTVLPEVLLLPPDPFFLSVIPRSLETFMSRSANWNAMIPLIWVSSKYAGVSCDLPSGYYTPKYLAPSRNQSQFIYITTIPFCTHYLKCKYKKLLNIFACRPL